MVIYKGQCKKETDKHKGPAFCLLATKGLLCPVNSNIQVWRTAKEKHPYTVSGSCIVTLFEDMFSQY